MATPTRRVRGLSFGVIQLLAALEMLDLASIRIGFHAWGLAAFPWPAIPGTELLMGRERESDLPVRFGARISR